MAYKVTTILCLGLIGALALGCAVDEDDNFSAGEERSDSSVTQRIYAGESFSSSIEECNGGCDILLGYELSNIQYDLNPREHTVYVELLNSDFQVIDSRVETLGIEELYFQSSISGVKLTGENHIRITMSGIDSMGISLRTTKEASFSSYRDSLLGDFSNCRANGLYTIFEESANYCSRGCFLEEQCPGDMTCYSGLCRKESGSLEELKCRYGVCDPLF